MKPESTDVRQTSIGFVALWIAIGFLAVGAVTLSGPVFLIGLIIAGAWLAGRHLASKQLDGLTIQRTLPARTWTNRRFAVEASIKNEGNSAYNFVIHDPIAVGKSEPISELVSGKEKTTTYAARCSRRGRVRIENWSIQSDWPLGWFESRRSGEFKNESGNSILVLPDPWLPPRLRDHLEGVLLSTSPWTGIPDPVSEFRFLREFRGGDPMRKIHWPASLKSGDLLVRETDPPRPLPTRYGILLHSFCPSGELVTPESFETILRITAGLLYRFRDAGIKIVFQSLPREETKLRHREDFDRELDQLALLTRMPFSHARVFQDTLDAFESCDEIFVVGDASRELWESEVTPLFRVAHCIDAKSVTFGRRATATPAMPRLIKNSSSTPRKRIAS